MLFPLKGIEKGSKTEDGFSFPSFELRAMAKLDDPFANTCVW